MHLHSWYQFSSHASDFNYIDINDTSAQWISSAMKDRPDKRGQKWPIKIMWPVNINGFGACYMLNVGVLSRYLRCYMLNVGVLSRYLRCYVLNVGVLSRYLRCYMLNQGHI